MRRALFAVAGILGGRINENPWWLEASAKLEEIAERGSNAEVLRAHNLVAHHLGQLAAALTGRACSD